MRLMKFFLFLTLFSMSIIFARILDRCSLLSYVLSEFLLSCEAYSLVSICYGIKLL